MQPQLNLSEQIQTENINLIKVIIKISKKKLNISLFLYQYSNFNRFIYNFRGEKKLEYKG